MPLLNPEIRDVPNGTEELFYEGLMLKNFFAWR